MKESLECTESSSTLSSKSLNLPASSQILSKEEADAVEVEVEVLPGEPFTMKNYVPLTLPTVMFIDDTEVIRNRRYFVLMDSSCKIYHLQRTLHWTGQV